MANYSNAIRRAAQKYGLNPDLFHRQIMAESGGNPKSTSGAGAQGIAQIMPGTAKSWGVNPNDPKAALDAAAKHMADYTKQYGGGSEGFKKALIAYNAGPGAVGGKGLPKETQNYISKIMGGGVKGAVTTAPSSVLASLKPGTSYGAATDPRQAKAAALASYVRNAGKPGATLKLVTDVKAAEAGATPTATPGATTTPSGPGAGSSDIVSLGKVAQEMGLHVGENPAFGGVGGSHVPNSYHYKGEAIDVSGDPEKMKAFNERMYKEYGQKLKELFYNGPGGKNVKDGKPQKLGFVSGHKDHVHVAM
jgi:hypothetical protein